MMNAHWNRSPAAAPRAWRSDGLKRVGAAMALTVALFLSSIGSARAEWSETSEIIHGTAHTLAEDEVAFGLLAPLQYGVNDTVTLGIHPILLLIGAPHITLRLRLTSPGAIALAAEIGGAWSFLQTVDPLGRPDDGTCTQELLGFPGTAQAGLTATFEVAPTLSLSVGGAFAMDFLDIEPVRYLIEGHIAAHWLIEPEDMLMIQVSTYFDVEEQGLEVLRRPTAQITWAHDFGPLTLAAGIAIGSFPLKVDSVIEMDWPVYPVLDLWWRL